MRHGNNQSHSSDNARSLTCCTTREFLIPSLWKHPGHQNCYSLRELFIKTLMLRTTAWTWALVKKSLTHNSGKLWADWSPCLLHRKASPWASGINISLPSRLLKSEPRPWICQPREDGLKGSKEEKAGTDNKARLERQPMGQRRNQREIEKKNLEMKENGNTAYQNLWDVAKAALRGKFIGINIYVNKKRKTLNKLTLHLKKWEKEQSPKLAEERK